MKLLRQATKNSKSPTIVLGAHLDIAPGFSLSSPEGGEGRGEEASVFAAQNPSPQPSPRLGGERESGAVSRCALVLDYFDSRTKDEEDEND